MQGFSSPTEVQQKCIPIILRWAGGDWHCTNRYWKNGSLSLPILMKVKYAQGTNHVPHSGTDKGVNDSDFRTCAGSLAKYTDLRILPIYGGIGPKTQIEMIQNGIGYCDRNTRSLFGIVQQGRVPYKPNKISGFG